MTIRARIIQRTKEIKVGSVYFLSSFYDKDGAIVEVLEKSTKTNKAGWPSSVKVQVLETIGTSYVSRARIITVNATNLYETREAASAAFRYGPKPA